MSIIDYNKVESHYEILIKRVNPGSLFLQKINISFIPDVVEIANPSHIGGVGNSFFIITSNLPTMTPNTVLYTYLLATTEPNQGALSNIIKLNPIPIQGIYEFRFFGIPSDAQFNYAGNIQFTLNFIKFKK